MKLLFFIFFLYFLTLSASLRAHQPQIVAGGIKNHHCTKNILPKRALPLSAFKYFCRPT